MPMITYTTDFAHIPDDSETIFHHQTIQIATFDYVSSSSGLTALLVPSGWSHSGSLEFSPSPSHQALVLGSSLLVDLHFYTKNLQNPTERAFLEFWYFSCVAKT